MDEILNSKNSLNALLSLYEPVYFVCLYILIYSEISVIEFLSKWTENIITMNL